MILPKIQLIRRDGNIIELDVLDIAFNIQRGVAVWAMPVFAVRAGLDLNANLLNIQINGVITDDKDSSGSAGAVASLDLSRGTGVFDSWFAQQTAQGNNTMALVKAALHGKELVFSTAGQINAGLGEDVTLRFDVGSTFTSSVATKSVVRVNLSGTINNTGDINVAIQTAINASSVKVDTVTTALSSILTVALSAGAKASNSKTHQGLGSNLTNEKLTLTNAITGSSGNTTITKQGSSISTTSDWSHSFFTSNFTGGVDGSRKTKGDKIQDLINMTMNASAGGGMLSPQSFTGDLIEMPDALSSFDVSKLLRIDQAESVKKYIVGLRIPYESMASASGVSEEIRQFIVPAGQGTDYAAEKNTEPFDPSQTVDGEVIRPNPFFRQGIAIPGVVQTFTPAYVAGDSVWTYTLAFAAVEQLIGI